MRHSLEPVLTTTEADVAPLAEKRVVVEYRLAQRVWAGRPFRGEPGLRQEIGCGRYRRIHSAVVLPRYPTGPLDVLFIAQLCQG